MSVRVGTYLRRSSRKRWYHGTSRKAAEQILQTGFLSPGMPTRYTKDLPREDAVYVAARNLAEQYALEAGAKKGSGGGVILEVEIEDPSLLIPDEDVIFGLLGFDEGWTETAKTRGLPKEIRLSYWEWKNATADPWERETFGLAEGLVWRVPDDALLATRTWFDELYANMAEGTTPSDHVKAFTEWLRHNKPELVKRILDRAWTAAHLGPVRVKRLVE